MADSSREPVVVIGLGRFGSSLALELTSRGTEVLAVDNRPKVVQSLSGRLTHTVTADCTDIEALRQLGVPDFSRAVVAIGSDIESSILVTSLLTELEIENIWAKAISIQHGRILDRIGAHHVVFPEHDMGERVAHLVSGRMLDYIELDPAHALVKVSPPGELVGVPLREARVRNRYDVTVVAVQPSGGEFTHTTPDTVLAYGDVILILGRIDKVERFANLP
ncbi:MULTISPECIES: potassium channel family protein [Streptomyces]|uniref:potassium channel family protein n=1 Tax=Streptomyces TaxID=1883 RepID=UPI001D144940|nr:MULTISPECIES: TrkA family potassium uptake protein [Streptomyces]MCC3652669.1 TrkA family potassium uptake protein [Streptomyces sp. S07_1.15]WSQ72688.1 TrkA family potassium uptake protein [Streptomyces xinghaiensis]